MTNTPASLRQVVAFRLRQYRDESGIAGLTQDHVARAAQRLGFDWSRSSVAAIEAGEREVTAAELLALPYILDEAMRVSMPGAEVAYFVSLADLLKPGNREVLALADDLVLDAESVEEWLGQEPPDIAPRKLDAPRTSEIGEADFKAARRLGVDVDTLHATALRLWGRGLTEERDARLSARENLTPQARGHVTRELTAELQERLPRGTR